MIIPKKILLQTKRVLVKNEFNEVSENVKPVSTKGLTKDLINKFSIFKGAKHFSSGIFQSYLMFIPGKKCIKYCSGATWIDLWKSDGMSEENIENRTKSDKNFALTFVDHHLLPDINFNGHCLIENKSSISKWVINLYISYKLNPELRNLNTDFTLCHYFWSRYELICAF